MQGKISVFITLSMALMLVACGGPRINRKAQEPQDLTPMLVAQDPHITVALDLLMFRNSQGSWAKDANWDEYLLSVYPKSEVVIESVLIEDLMGDSHQPETTRKALNESTKSLKKKYKKAGYKVKIGSGSTHATAVGLSFAVGSGITAGTMTATGAVGNLTSVGVGVAVAVPALVIAGVTKIVYNTRVNNRIQERQTLLPLKSDGNKTTLDLLFPAVPLPQKLVVHYMHDNVSHQIALDLTQITTNLHIKPDKE